MTLREQILALPPCETGATMRARILALLSEGPTPTQIEAAAQALNEFLSPDNPANWDWEGSEDVWKALCRERAEAVLRAGGYSPSRRCSSSI